jgi:purine catabolism regulator
VAGFVLELCRFFTEAPTGMADEATNLGLPMVGFRALVPFVEVTEAVNSTIVDAQVHRLRRVDEVSRGPSEALAGEGGVSALLSRLAAILGRPVALTGPLGETLVENVGGFTPTGGRRSVEECEAELPDCASVIVHGAVWGVVADRHPDGDRMIAQAALERAAEIVALGLRRGERDVSLASRNTASLWPPCCPDVLRARVFERGSGPPACHDSGRLRRGLGAR